MVISIDTETVSLTNKTLIAFSYTTEDDKTHVIPIRMNTYANYSVSKAKILLSNLIKNNKVIFHNSSFDVPTLVKFGIPLEYFKDVEDTLIMANLYNETEKHGLKQLVKKYFNHTMTEFKDVCGVGQKRISFADVEWDKAEAYAGEDSYWTMQLYKMYLNKLDKQSMKIYNEIEKPLLIPVADMRINGVSIDISKVNEIKLMCEKKIEEATKILDKTMKNINLNSPKQLKKYFIDKKGLEILKLTKTGQPAMDSEVLKQYVEVDEDAKTLLEYRKYNKILSTFIPALTPIDGNKVYPNFNQAGTISGRFSCVPFDAEILTKRGWKKYFELNIIDKVAGYNFDTKLLEWTELEHVNTYKNVDVGIFSWRHYKGYAKQQDQEVYCTNNHKWLCNIQGVNGYIESQDINIKKNFLHNFILTAEGLDVDNKDSILNVIESGILGWALTDGHVIKLKSGYSCDIQVLKNSSFRYLQELLSAINHNYGKYYRGREYQNKYRHRFYIPKHIFTPIWEKYLYYKETLIFKLSKKCKEEMLNSMLEADGTPRKITKSFYSQKDDVSELFSLLAFTLGYKVHTKQHNKLVKIEGYSNISDLFSITKKEYEKHVYFKDKIKKCDVWCPTTKLGSWIMKQNNQIIITGNSSNPNFQNLPREDDEIKLRHCIIPDEGHILIDADYSQIELRIAAHFSQDKNMIEIYKNNGDIHQKTADACGCTRQDAKVVNFGIIYGMGSKTLAKTINVSVDEAEHYINKYFKQYPQIEEYWNLAEEVILEKGYIENWFGRKRRLSKEFWHKDDYGKGNELRSMLNHIVQGTAADVLKKAMSKMYQPLKDIGARIVLTVHDEVLISSPIKVKEQAYKIIEQSMLEAGKDFRVPITVEVKYGETWGESH